MAHDATAAGRQCPSCGLAVGAEDSFCVRCGTRLEAAAKRRGFAAAPNEPEFLPALVSTVFPQLPRASMATFRIALALGVGAVVVLALARLFPVAIVASAVLVPLLTVLYLYDVDVYEDEPVRVILFTMLAGAGSGIALGVLARELAPTGVEAILDTTDDAVLVRGLLLPLLAVALSLVGPLVLLPYRKFNDVLDGATFGAASAVSLVGAQLIVSSLPMLGAGLRPVGQIWPWVARLLELAVALPLMSAGVVGAVAGAFWLRYRAPVRDRRALGALSHPLLAVGLAAAFFVGAALTQLFLPAIVTLVVLFALAAAALVWLRRVLHVGLLQEAAEIDVGPALQCANCGHRTPQHSFCANCGISLRALPKGRSVEGLPVEPSTTRT